MKEIIRRILFAWNWLICGDGQFIAQEGTLKLKFFQWLYGNEDAEKFTEDGWNYPQEEDSND